MKRSRILLPALLILGFSFTLQSCVVSRPLRPGPGFLWVSPYKTPRGVHIPGYWKYTGPPQHNRAWVPGHFNASGKWVSGHWRKLRAPKKGAVWVPGSRTPEGRWHEGRWRYP
ncbi:MAG: hypothetical protein OQK66_06550 [Prosthecochloris sp.]|uniref:Lipoprotein n=1 Tax=Prosthecochloris aestuarii (strain DSM 271 / SK 413) TaxID=290512 RepID=B4S4N8_PROA2|nr:MULTISPECIES: hypothetical protein [Prosthecochloris]ACF46934.1 hypothetical protein Paes_1922 [Prosthecochloris aestuarii DSM 271]MCW8798611.1 hypothetical protein [Prosthecochloris sp.]NEX11093.1 hypothetical protein [Prosthecochloris sp.]RDD29535.1 hypothetical protein CR161_01755 [Prosthecochloris sp. ZM]